MELFIVEGESAAAAIRQVCEPAAQAVHPIQGKPMNVFRASARAIRSNERVVLLQRHITEQDPAFERVIIITDANPDGVHAKALLLGVIAETMPQLIEAGRLFTIRAPEYAVGCAERADPVFAYDDAGRASVLAQLSDRGATRLATQHYSGLASMSDRELTLAFTDPDTRSLAPLTSSHVDTARAVLS